MLHTACVRVRVSTCFTLHVYVRVCRGRQGAFEQNECNAATVPGSIAHAIFRDVYIQRTAPLNRCTSGLQETSGEEKGESGGQNYLSGVDPHDGARKPDVQILRHAHRSHPESGKSNKKSLPGFNSLRMQQLLQGWESEGGHSVGEVNAGRVWG